MLKNKENKTAVENESGPKAGQEGSNKKYVINPFTGEQVEVEEQEFAE
jgi:hypothetical protein